MTIREFIYKFQRKIYILKASIKKNHSFEEYCNYYCSYKHSLRHTAKHKYINYITARPNPGAGIGHQIANWMAGYYLAKLFNLKFAHIPFSNISKPFMPNDWEEYLGLGKDEILYKDLLKCGYKKIILPLFNPNNKDQVGVIKKIIDSYTDEKVVFLCEQDQFYRDLHTLIPDLKQKYYSTSARKHDDITYNPNNYNIAIHVRRGDIMLDPTNPNLTMRYLSNNYFEKVLSQIINNLQTNKAVHIYLFSQGKPEDYPEFSKIPNIHWCMDMNAISSFTHMVNADLLITSKSSFSYKPALLNNGIKVCPQNFWHGYPVSSDWIMVDNEGNILTKNKTDYNH